MPNPTDAARALVRELEEAARETIYASMSQEDRAAQRLTAETELAEARAALLAHVAGVEQERDRLLKVVGMVGEPEVYVPTHLSIETCPTDDTEPQARPRKCDWSDADADGVRICRVCGDSDFPMIDDYDDDDDALATRPTEARDE